MGGPVTDGLIKRWRVLLCELDRCDLPSPLLPFYSQCPQTEHWRCDGAK
jgi:hypothetical protein